jgi:four helix bundle protein
MARRAAPKYMASVTVHDLDLWQDSITLVKAMRDAVQNWPCREADGLAAQALRISVAIPVSLADRRGQHDPAQGRRFAQMAIGSACELDTLLLIAAELGYQDIEEISLLRRNLAVLMRRIESFICAQEWRLR